MIDVQPPALGAPPAPETPAVRWCRQERAVRQRSAFAVHTWLKRPGIGVLHACGAVIASLMVFTAIGGRLLPGGVAAAIGPVLASAIVLTGVAMGVWGLLRANRDYEPGTPAGPEGDWRVQCSASKRVKPGLGRIVASPFEPELFGVWFSDAPRAAGRIRTTVAALLGVGAMATVNWIAFRNPLHSSWVTLGLAGPALGVAAMGVVLPVEWKFTPGRLEIIRPGLLGLGWGASARVIELARAKVFVDADDREAMIITPEETLQLRWDIATHRDEITRAMLLAALTAPLSVDDGAERLRA